MKKLLVLVFALVMLCSLVFAFNVFAEDEATDAAENTNIANQATVTTNNSHWHVVGNDWSPNTIPYLTDGDPLTGIPSCAKSGTNVQTFTFAEKKFVEKIVLLVNGYGKRGNIDTLTEENAVNINANYTVKAYDADGKQVYSKMLSSLDQTELIYEFDEPTYIKKVTVEYASGYNWGAAFLREVEIHEKVVVSDCEEHITEMVVTVNPGCTTNGEYSMVCTVCGAVTTTKEIPAVGHTMGDDYRIKTPATCISAPVVEYNCTVCGSLEERDAHVDDVTDYIDLSAVKTDGAGGWTTSHMALFDNNMDSYLMASGGWYVQSETVLDRNYYISSVTIWAATNSDSSWLILYYKAPGSDEWIEAGKVHVPDDAVASSYTLELAEPVYASAIKVFVGGPDGQSHGGGPGVASYSGCVYEAKVTGSLVADTAAGHTWVVGETVAPTCTVQGYTKYTCSVCDAEKTGDYVKWTGHTWVSADCVTPKTCSVCGATEGEALGHTMSAATCTAPATCSVCGATEGDALGHTMSDATCTTPATCSVCGATEGEALGHTMSAATCTAPATCSVCGATEGEALGQHIYDLSNAVTDGNVITIACTNGCGAAATITINGTVAQAGFNMMMQQAVVSVYAPSYGKLTAVASEGSVCLLVTNPRLPAQSFTAPMIVNIDGFNDTYVIVPQFSSTDAAPSITITYEALTPATIVEGENTVDTSKGDTKVQFVVVESGKYNFVLNADAMILTEYGAVAAWEGPFEYEAGDVIEIIVMPYGAPSVDITVEKIVEHTHTEVEIPAVLPTPKTTGYTAGVKCSECDETIVEPKEISVVDLYTTDTSKRDPFRFTEASLFIEQNVSMNYTVNPATNKYNFSKVYAVFYITGDDGVEKETIVEAYTVRGSYYVFNFDGTAMHLMAENITAYVYGIDADGTYYRNMQTNYSVLQYCVNQIGKAASSAELKTLLSDILVIGTETQKYRAELRGETVVESELILNKAKAKGCNVVSSTFSTIPGDCNKQVVTGDRTSEYTDLREISLLLGEQTDVVVKFNSPDPARSSVKIYVPSSVDPTNVVEYVFTEEDFVYVNTNSAKEDIYKVTLDKLTSAQYDTAIVIEFYTDGVQTGRTLQYSINTYLQKYYNNAAYPMNLLRAIYLLGESVTAYRSTL